MDPFIGLKLKERYRVKSRLGEGTMGSIYRGFDTETGRDVAIKIMHPALMKEQGMLARFRREAVAMRRVCHPNAVQVFAHGVDGGLVFLVMELVIGRDLGELLAAEGRLSAERAARIVADVCGALGAAHAQGLVHRDVKPQNVMLCGAGDDAVRLVDFGFAKDFSGPEERASRVGCERICDSIPDDVDLLDAGDVTAAGALVGSPGYMAPEQWAGGAVDARTDVYACGVVLYELVTGELPFLGDNAFVVVSRQIRERPVAPHELNPDVPEELSRIILRALSPVPSDRYPSADEMARALDMFLLDGIVSQRLGIEATAPVHAAALRPAEGAGALDQTLPLPAEEEEARDSVSERPSRSIGYGGPQSSRSPALSRPSFAVAPRATRGAQLRSLLPLMAAFLALGVIVGLLLHLPHLHH